MHLSPTLCPSLSAAERPKRSLRSRRGVTLVELLVVILLLGITAALVLPALRPPRAASVDSAALLTRARRTAIRRGESLRLRVAADGVWGLVTARDGAAVETGRLALDRRTLATGANRALDVTADTSIGVSVDISIDALGSCRPLADAASASGFDPLACRWLPEGAATVVFGTTPNRSAP